MVRKVDEILTYVLEASGIHFFQAAPNFYISVDKGPGKEHLFQDAEVNFSNVAVRYTNADPEAT